MAAASGSALALAARLRALDDDALERLVRERELRRPGIRDYFDLAEALLDGASIQAALGRLDRPTLALLVVAGELAATSGAPTEEQLAATLGVDADELSRRARHALELGLMGSESGRLLPWDAVVEQLRAWPSFGLPGARELVTAPPPPALEPVSEADARFVDRGAAERAFASVTAVAELILELRAAPARRLSRGGVALPDARRLAAASGIEPESLELLLELGERAGLLVAAPRRWEAAPEAEAWLALPRLDRWAVLAAGWLDRLRPEIQLLLRQRARAVWGEGLLDYLRWLYPAGGDRVAAQVGRVAGEAELLGIVGAGAPGSTGTALLLGGPEAAARELAAHFPAEIDQVYLQNDLSIVAPGPLEPAVDLELRSFAEAETRGPASSFRITADGVTRALVGGATAEGILAFLERISIGPVPQPVGYLVRDTAARFGMLRVGELPAGAGARAYLRSDDPALIAQLQVDPRLAVLSLAPGEEGRLVTRLVREVAYWTLVDARYPVVAEDAAGRIVDLERPAAVGAEGELPDDTAAILVTRLRDTGGQAETADDGDWIVRQLELAVKNRLAVMVRIRMPDGSEAELALEPAAIAGGRLRARDRRSDLERTLPVSHIVAVTPAS